MSSADDNYSLFKIFAAAPRTTRGKQTHISVNPLGTKFLYCNGQSVFIRDIEDPSDVDVYTQHARDTTVAVYSPSSYYIASGDISGKVRIWDTVNKEHILKYEYQLLGGPIRDIAWSEDSKKIAVCGEGKEEYAKVINWDTGTTVGSLSGASKSCNQLALKQSRPYRIVLGSEDHSVYFFEGYPMKKFQNPTENHQFNDHTNFVNCVRFSPDGSKYATAGADKKCFVFDGKTGAQICELNEAAGGIHKGGVYGLAWSPDGKFLMTASADKTVKIWAMDGDFHLSDKEAKCVTMGNELGDMQVGCAWAKSELLSISLNGDINYLDLETQSPSRVVKGHVKAIVTSCLSADKSSLFTASFDGTIYCWDLRTGQAELVEGNGHKSQVQNMSLMGAGDVMVTCSMDDTVRYVSVKEKKYVENKIVKMESQPQRLAAGSDGNIVVACTGNVLVINKNETKIDNKVNYEPTCAAICTALGKVAIGSNQCKVFIYDIQKDGQLKQCDDSIPTNGNVTDVKFSPNGAYLAMSTGKKQVKVVDVNSMDTPKMDVASHAVKVNGIAWSLDSQFVTSCGIDGVVFTYSVESGDKVVTMRGAHCQSVDVTSVQWSGDNILLTTGRQDCSVRMWKVHFE